MSTSPLQRLTFILTLSGLFALSADFACNDDVCPTERGALYRTMDDIGRHRIELFDQALARSNVVLDAAQRQSLARDGHVFGAAKLDRPVKHADGAIEMPPGWLPAVPDGHPWARPLAPSDDAFYSWFEERIVGARLYDPANPRHVAWATAYLAEVDRRGSITGWTFASPTECPKKKPE